MQRTPLHATVQFAAAFITCITVGCQKNAATIDSAQVAEYQDRMAESPQGQVAPDLATIDRPAPVDLSGEPKSSAGNLSLDTTIWLQLPDPTKAEEIFKKRLEVTRFSQNIKREYEKITSGP